MAEAAGGKAEAGNWPEAICSHATEPERLPLGKQWMYAIGQMGWGSLTGLVGLQLVYFYLPPVDTQTGEPKFPVYITQAKIFYVLNVITILATTGRLWDAVTDPVIASLSDRLEHRRGRRIPFLAVGGLPSAVFCALLFVPVVGEESAWNIVWLGLVQMLFYFSLTLYVTPYFSLVSELGHTPQERLDLSTWISITYALGTVLASGAPAIGSVFGFDEQGSLHAGVIIVCVIGVVCMYVPVLAIDERRYSKSEPSQIGIIAALRHCIQNPHFRPYVAADFSYWFGTAIISTGMPYYLTVLARLESKYLLAVIGTLAVLSFLFYYPTNRLASRFGKKRIVMVSLGILALVFALIFFVGWLPLPAFVQIFAVGALASFPLASLGVLPNSILSDIAAHDSQRTGHNQEGMYFAARALLSKMGQSCGIMVFAGLTNFGKDVGDDLGIRLSGLVGLGFDALALVIFSFYREDEVLLEHQATAGEDSPGVDGPKGAGLAQALGPGVFAPAPLPQAVPLPRALLPKVVGKVLPQDGRADELVWHAEPAGCAAKAARPPAAQGALPFFGGWGLCLQPCLRP
mmetsp:Transcript_62263/g.181891  ORF Transcript_62263/g.181891 Transcript_62263/m.181891 type:complete len:573 (-) Transcript_62263:13-1731(-)